MSIAYIFIVLSNNIFIDQCKRDCLFIEKRDFQLAEKFICHDGGWIVKGRELSDDFSFKKL